MPSSLKAIGALAAWHRSRFDIPVIGITGSVGKTTTKEMISAVLSQRFNVHKTEKNFNNELGVPQTLLGLDDAHEVAVVEMGISDFGEMRRLTHMVRPTIAVFSVIGHAHLEFLGDRSGVMRAKGEIFEGMNGNGLAIVNGDDDLLRACEPGMRKVMYGVEQGNDLVAEDIRSIGAEAIECTVRHDGKALRLHIPAFGQHMVYAALAGVAAGLALGMTDEAIAEGIARYETVGNRAKVIRANGITVVSDCYNANPNSTAAAILSLAQLEGRKICVLGDMLELGENSPALHYAIGEKAAQAGVELVLACGALSENTCRGAMDAGTQAQWFESREALIEALPTFIRPGDNILVKASNSMKFDAVTEALIR